jgi:hypothetical protein
VAIPDAGDATRIRKAERLRRAERRLGRNARPRGGVFHLWKLETAKGDTNMNLRRNYASRTEVGRNVLVVALYVVSPSEVAGAARVLVVAPASDFGLGRRMSDKDTACAHANERAAVVVDLLERRGARAEGRVGDRDPLQAIADALPTFPADEIVIAIPPQIPRRRTDELLEEAYRRFALPVRRATAAEPLQRAA